MTRSKTIGWGSILAVPILVIALLTGTTRWTTHTVMPSGSHEGLGWHASWRAAPQPPIPSGQSHDGLNHQTVRMILHLSVGGRELRVHLSNSYGTTPLQVGEVAVGKQDTGATVIPGTQRVVTFDGSETATIPVGAELVSDPVRVPTNAGANVDVSVYLPRATGPTTWHRLAQTTSYISSRGNWAAETGGSPYQTITPSWFFVDGVDVLTRPLAGTIVAFGDSITDGAFSTLDADHTYPEWLARKARNYAVLNEGIGGNEILADVPVGGQSALLRFEKDAVDQLGVTDIIFLEGVNDIGKGNATADQLIDAMHQLIEVAHAHCLTMIGGTLTPFKNSAYFTSDHEKTREAVNQWIRTSGEFDGVADFDRALRDPADPLVINPTYHTVGDLHPNDRGYRVMADVAAHSLLAARPRCGPR